MKKKLIALLVLIAALVMLSADVRAQVTGSTMLTVSAIHTVGLTWIASTSPGVTGFNIYRGSSHGGPYTKINHTLITGVSYTDATVTSGNFYCYVVTAYAPTGFAFTESGYSNESCQTLP